MEDQEAIFCAGGVILGSLSRAALHAKCPRRYTKSKLVVLIIMSVSYIKDLPGQASGSGKTKSSPVAIVTVGAGAGTGSGISEALAI